MSEKLASSFWEDLDLGVIEREHFEPVDQRTGQTRYRNNLQRSELDGQEILEEDERLFTPIIPRSNSFKLFDHFCGGGSLKITVQNVAESTKLDPGSQKIYIKSSLERAYSLVTSQLRDVEMKRNLGMDWDEHLQQHLRTAVLNLQKNVNEANDWK